MKKLLCIFLIICAKIIEIDSATDGDATGSSQGDNKGKRPLDAYSAGQMSPINEFAAQLISSSSESSGNKRIEGHASPNERAEPGESDSLPEAIGNDNEVEIVGQQHSTHATEQIHQQSPSNLNRAREQPKFVAGSVSAFGGGGRGQSRENYQRPMSKSASEIGSISQQQTNSTNVQNEPINVKQTQTNPTDVQRMPNVWEITDDLLLKVEPKHYKEVIQKFTGNTAKTDPFVRNLINRHLGDEKAPPRAYKLSLKKRKDESDLKMPSGSSGAHLKLSEDIRQKLSRTFNLSKDGSQDGFEGQSLKQKHQSDQNPFELHGNEPKKTRYDPKLVRSLIEMLPDSHNQAEQLGIGEIKSLPLSGQMPGIEGPSSSHLTHPAGGIGESSKGLHQHHLPLQIPNQHGSEAQLSHQQQYQSTFQQNPLEFFENRQQQSAADPNLNRSLFQFLQRRKFKQNEMQSSDIGESSRQKGESSQGIHQHYLTDSLHPMGQSMQSEFSDQPRQVEHEQIQKTYQEDLNKLFEYLETINFNLEKLHEEDGKLKLEQNQIYHVLMPSQIMEANLSTDYVQKLHERKIELRNERRVLANQIDEFEDGKLQILWEIYEKMQNQPKPTSSQ